ncbi:DUF1569 domain-containing protein [Maribacter flavus]|uniref:DUF1569 domain-containing protein n=1 Tax=Maribacter flavus TaxID=1658664 RepID=A0A5B2TW15_9FLAO|nr:DUF1569 domain-containing protein [Maribacter flavus]KAA2218128.1 DUF1569 domain-containing protein [Maribacter flavus]
MTWKNLFDKQECEETIARINNLTPETAPQWGKMNVSQMLAHCNVAYETTYTDKHPKPKGLQKFLIKLLAKNTVVGPKPYKKNGPTSPVFKISDERDFEKEKNSLIANMRKTQELGSAHFDGKESYAFGTLTKTEWNTLFSKHLEHHLQQFGV